MMRSGLIGLSEVSLPCRSRYGEKVSLNLTSLESSSSQWHVPDVLGTRKRYPLPRAEWPINVPLTERSESFLSSQMVAHT